MTFQPPQPSDIGTLLQQAANLHKQGQPARALPLYLQALQLAPSDSGLLNLVGQAYLDNKEPEQALFYLDRAMAIFPQGENFYLHRGNAHLALGHHQEALHDYQIAAQQRPSDPAPWINSVGAYHKSGRHKEAECAARTVVRMAPQIAEAWHNLAHVLYSDGSFSDAELCARKAADIAPDKAMAWFTLADSLRAQNSNCEAESAFKKALELDNNLVPCMVNLANLYASVGRYKEAIFLYEKVLSIDPQQVEASANLGATLVDVGREDDAERWLRITIAKGQNTPHHVAALAYALRASGKVDQAVSTIRDYITKNNPLNHSVVAVWAELGLERPEIRAQAISDIHRWLETEGPSAPVHQRAEMLLRLAALHDKEQHHNEAFSAALEAKNLLGTRSDPSLEQALADRIEQAFTAQRLRTHPYGLINEFRPIFIVGMPRSGTSLLEQILAAHPAVHGGGEIEEMGLIATELSGTNPVVWPSRVVQLDEYSLQALAQRWLHPLVQEDHQALRFTDKMPHNFTYLGLITLLFPKARIIHIRRDPRDVALSIFFHHFTGHHPYAYHIEDLTQHYRFYERLMAHWRLVLPSPMMEINYEHLTADPKTQIQRLLDFVGLPWDDNVLNFHKERRAILTASRFQVKEPIHRRAEGRWRPYQNHLSLFLKKNQDIIQEYEKELGR
jgi:tetratricopeptide (TPR) repeat protein